MRECGADSEIVVIPAAMERLLKGITAIDGKRFPNDMTNNPQALPFIPNTDETGERIAAATATACRDGGDRNL
jgi:hypothetical protein